MRILRVAHHGVVDAWRARERELRVLGEDVVLFSARQWDEGGRRIDLDPGADRFVRGVRTLGRHPNGFVFDPLPLWRALGQRIDVLDLHEEPFSLATAEILALRWLRRRRPPYVLYSAQNIDKRYPVPIRWFERWALRGAAGAYVCNREAGEILRRKGLRGVVELIPLGVDLDRFRPGDRSAPQDGPVIGYVGRLERHKGVDRLLRAVAPEPSWRVEITGDGPERDRLAALAASLGISDRVAFLGFAAGDDLAERYRRLDVIAVPSLPTPGWLEQFCRVAVEAMASGVPIVASDSGAIPDVVGEAGILVPPGDEVALRAGLADALRPAEWTRLRDLGRARAPRFTWERVAAQQQALYREVAGGAASRPGIEVVVVAYGDPDLLEGALEHLGPGSPVTIVDNSSSERTRALAERLGATYLDPGANLGFGAGVNVALRSLADRGLGDHDVLLLNPDARIAAEGVRRMHETLRSAPDLAAVGATQVDPGTGRAVRVWWPFPSPARAWREAVGLGRLSRARDFVIGSVLLLRAEAIADVGEFDERYFLYAEETDWQATARARGWRIALADVVASHIGGGTSSDESRREGHFFASMELFVRKHHGARGWASFRRAMIVGAQLRIPLHRGAARDTARRRRDLFRAAVSDGPNAPR